jgi:PII-like signaling protein
MGKQIKQQKITLIRIYTDDSNGHINQMLEQLHQRDDVNGATIFRGIAGFGKEGRIHQSSLLDLSSQLPIVIELFHKSTQSEELINFIHTQISNAHIVSWDANLSFEHID